MPVMPRVVMQRLRQWPCKLALALAAIFVALLIGELIVRAFGAVPPVRPLWASSRKCIYQRADNPLLSIELKPNFRDPDPDLTRTYERTNAHGLRDRPRSIPKPEGVRRILLLGDSVVEGHGIPESQTIAHQWEALYEDGRTEVLNLGISGYITRSEVELLEVKGLQFDPDVVVLVFVANDFQNFIVEALPLDTQVVRPNWSKHLFVESHLFRLLAIRFNLYDFGINTAPLQRNRSAIGDNNVVDGLARLRELAVEHGFEPLIAIWPWLTNDAIRNMFPMPDGDGDLVIERLARMYDISSVRLSRYFDEHRDRYDVPDPRLAYSIGDGMHPSQKGCTVAAEALKRIVADLQQRLDNADGGQRWANPVQPDPPAVAAAAERGAAEPNYARVYVSQGHELLQQGRLDEAIEKFSRAAELNPELYKPYLNRGNAYLQLGKYAPALADYATAIRLEPYFANTYYKRGVVFTMLGKYEPAADDFTKVIELRPELEEAYLNRGTVYFQLGKYAPALADYATAIELRPGEAPAYYNRGTAYRELGKYELALADFDRAIELRPDHAESYYKRGTVHRHLRGFDRALADFSKVIELTPDHAQARYDRGNVYRQLGKLDRALADFDRAIHLKPNHAEAYNNRGTVYGQLDETETALADFNRAIQLQPGFAKTFHNRGMLYRQTGEYELALADFSKRIELTPNHAKAYNNRGIVYVQLGKFDLALADFNRAIELTPDDAKAYHNRGMLYRQMGKDEAAQADFNRAIELKQN